MATLLLQNPGPLARVVYAEDERIATWQKTLFGPQGSTLLERSVFLGVRKCFFSNYLIFPGNSLFSSLSQAGGNIWAPGMPSVTSLTWCGSWRTTRLLPPHSVLIFIGTNDTNWHVSKMLRKMQEGNVSSAMAVIQPSSPLPSPHTVSGYVSAFFLELGRDFLMLRGQGRKHRPGRVLEIENQPNPARYV